MLNGKKFAGVALIALSGLFSASAQSTWNVAGDWNPPSNPNGAWSYGSISNGVFSTLAWTPGTFSVIPGGVYGSGALFNGAFVYQNTNNYTSLGIAPGQISLESDWGNAAVQWTAPATGVYNISVAIGGTTNPDVDGFGNNYATDAGFSINGVTQSDTSFSGNVMTWTINDLSLNAGDTLDAFVTNPGSPDGGSTEVQFAVAAPEPSTMALSAVGGLFSLLALRRRK